MRKKEEITVGRKMATKRNTYGCNNQLGNPVEEKNASAGRPGTSNHNSSYVPANGLNIRSRVKQQ
jgi:hypothetical protein